MRAHTARIQQCCLTLSFTQILEYISTVIWTVGTGFRRKLLMWLWWLCITVDHHRPCGQKVFARPAYCHTVVCVTWCTAMPCGMGLTTDREKEVLLYARWKEKPRCACGRRLAIRLPRSDIVSQKLRHSMPARCMELQSSSYIYPALAPAHCPPRSEMNKSSVLAKLSTKKRKKEHENIMM
ncbi:hypothetical protein F5888DRAFT_691702 [Russula emetica]|nr:hypothetical protein F5888DRAFT_691702 [Russula emetica]